MSDMSETPSSEEELHTFVIAEDVNGSIVANPIDRHRLVRREQEIVDGLWRCVTYGEVREFISSDPSVRDVVENYIVWFHSEDEGDPTEEEETDPLTHRPDNSLLGEISDDSSSYLPRLDDDTECQLPDEAWNLVEAWTPMMDGGDRFSIPPENLARFVEALTGLGHRVLWESASGELFEAPPSEPSQVRRAMESGS